MFAMTLAVVALAQSAGTEMKLLRFPAVHGDYLAFVFGGDIWTADLKGGLARCEMNQNVPTWRIVSQTCPQSKVSHPFSPIVISAAVGDTLELH